MSQSLSLEELSSHMSQLIPESKHLDFHSELSVKSTESVDHCELRFIYENIETLEQEAVENETIRDQVSRLGPVQTLLKYQNYFLLRENSHKLFRHYIKERCRLVHSPTKNLDFSIKEVLLRLKSGYTIFKYKHKKKLRTTTKIIVEDSVVKVKSKGSKCYKRIPFDCIFGIVIGCQTFRFKKNKEKLDSCCGVIHEDFECFSILTDKRSIDLASFSDLAFYDICIGLSWISFHYRSIPNSIPFSKCKKYSDSLTVTLVSLKLHMLASARYMSLVELFLLAICKTLKELKRDYRPILFLLNSRFTGAGKFFRCISRSVLPVLQEQKSKEALHNSLRVTSLAYSTQSSKNLEELTQALQLKNKKDLSPFSEVAFFVPSDSGIFDKPKSKANFSHPSTSKFTTTIRRSSRPLLKIDVFFNK